MERIQIQRLAEKVLGLTTRETDDLIDSGGDYDTPLKERFGVDLQTFGDIVSALIPLTPIIQEPKTHQLIHAFVEFQDGHGTILAKEAIDE
ncbi:hypothetical protein [Marinomonas posidonica]|uniref:Uncharacterized protein n=1 Tax=Marinomonas posidonica (strain CECT 7376 / NCIMB 14433 / IVIA-Po-181) TaxID=491952 RepID=F6CY87_MARPP|nr:hypothetical protein [Marinomonas posidonica]AEF53414.1 hypothetical protein Mar181_0349 [Marinomonas posidonica IVIA-Po-181]